MGACGGRLCRPHDHARLLLPFDCRLRDPAPQWRAIGKARLYREDRDRSARLTSHSEIPMAEVLLFHHAQGLTHGVRAFAEDLSAAGHTLHTPDLFDGRTFKS